MEGQADRAVLFTLTPAVAGDADQVFERFVSDAEAAYKLCQETAAEAAMRIAEDQQASAQLGTEAIRKAAREQQQILSQVGGRWSTTMADQIKAQATPTPRRAGEVDRDDAAMNREADYLRKRIESARVADLTPDQRYNEELTKSQKLLDAKKISEEEYAKAAAIAQQTRETSIRKANDAAQKAADQEQKNRDQQSKELARYQHEEKAANDSRRQHLLAMQDESVQALQGVIKIGKGFAELGIIGKDTAEEMVKGLVKIQAGYDILEGGFQAYRKIMGAVEQYRKSVEAATTAEEALAAARQMSTAAGGASTVAGVGSAAGAAGAVGGTAGLTGAGLVAGVTVIAAELAAVAALLTPGGRRAAEDYMIGLYGGEHLLPQEDKTPNPISWFGRANAYIHGAMSPTDMFLTGEDPFTSVEESQRIFENAKASQKQATDAERALEFRRTRAERITAEAELNARQQNAEEDAARRQRLAEAQAPIQQEYRAIQLTALEEDQRRRAELEKTRPDLWDSEENKAKYAMAGSHLEMEAAQRQRELEAQSGQAAAGVAYRLAQEEADKARKEAEAVRSRGPGATIEERAQWEADLASSGQQDLAAQERLAQANQARLDQEERIKQVRIQAADESIAKTQEEISLRQQLIDREKQRLMSAQERIASMTEAEQQEYARILEKARSGKELTSQEFQTLGSVNTEETERLKRSQAEQRSKAFMDRTGLGQEERDRIDRLQKEKQELEVTLKDQRDLRVSIERDDNETARRLGEEIRRQLEERDRKLIDQVRLEVERGKREVYDRMNQRFSQGRESTRR